MHSRIITNLDKTHVFATQNTMRTLRISDKFITAVNHRNNHLSRLLYHPLIHMQSVTCDYTSNCMRWITAVVRSGVTYLAKYEELLEIFDFVTMEVVYTDSFPSLQDPIYVNDGNSSRS